MIQRILCPVDFSDATEFALTPAISLATEFSAELVLAHVLDYPYPHVGPVVQGFDVETYYDVMEQKALVQLDALVDDDVRDYVQPRAVVRRGSAYGEIVRLAEEEDVDLIVLPTHARTGLDHVLWGSVAEKIVRLSPCPVMTVSPRLEQPRPFGGERILFATDFSRCSDNALPSALSIARHYGAELLMVHVVTAGDYDPANPEWRFPAISPQHRGAIEDASRQRLEQAGAAVGDADRAVAVRTLLVRGFDPGMEIARTAEAEEADLIVMATHGRTGVSHLVVGSAAEKVVRYAGCPVLTIKQECEPTELEEEE